MAETPQPPSDAEVRAAWGMFDWTPANAKEAKAILGALDIVFGECDR